MSNPDQAFQALQRWREFVRPIEQRNAAIEAELNTRHSLCMSGYEILHFLAGRRGKTALTEICRSIDRSQPRVSRLIGQLEERGMVERHRTQTDGRAYQITITRKGRRTMQAAAGTILGILDQDDIPANTTATM